MDIDNPFGIFKPFVLYVNFFHSNKLYIVFFRKKTKGVEISSAIIFITLFNHFKYYNKLCMKSS